MTFRWMCTALLLLAGPVALSQSYDMTIHLSTGETVIIPIDEIQRMAFTNIQTSVENPANAELAPGEFRLLQNYPNPFNPTTTIRYSVGELGSRQQAVGNRVVKLAVYDVLGREVAVLVDEKKQPGSYEVQFDGSGLPSGAYIAVAHCDGRFLSRRLVLIK